MACTIAAGEVIYVDDDADPCGDGLSWATAYKYLQDALVDANSNPDINEIWVAEGTYTPDSNSANPNGSGNREATFQLINGVGIYGGYAGYGATDPNARDIQLYETILSGDLDGNDVDVNKPSDLQSEPTRSENCYHIVTGTETDANAVIDGFTITGGYADIEGNGQTLAEGGGMYIPYGGPTVNNCRFIGNFSLLWGGGIWIIGVDCEPTLTNCTFTGNYSRVGGGICNYGGSPTLTNCNFTGNSADMDGGGIFSKIGNPILTNCTFIGNSAQDGGGMEQMLGEGTLINCTFSGNLATDRGGGMFNSSSSPTVSNCIFSGNSAGRAGGGLSICSGSPTVTNCIFTGNTADDGGGMSDELSGLTVKNCTFTGNTADSGGGIETSAEPWMSRLTVTNCILWGNIDSTGAQIRYYGDAPSVTYNDIQGGWEGATNINADPCFVTPGYWDANGTPDDTNDDFWVEGDYHLKSQAGRWEPNIERWVHDDVTSLCINTGNPKSSFALEPNPNGGRLNMGAYGGTEQASKSYCENPIDGDINGDCRVDRKDFAIMAAHWLVGVE